MTDFSNLSMKQMDQFNIKTNITKTPNVNMNSLEDSTTE